MNVVTVVCSSCSNANAYLRIQEKESELASIAAQRNRALAEQLEKAQEQERKGKDENVKLRSQLKQLTKDFQYNLELLKDRDTELELLENQIKAHKETSEQRSQELADAIRRIDEAKLSMVSCESRAEQALAQKAAAEERCANKLAVAQREHDASMADVLAQLDASKAQLQHEMAKLVDVRFLLPLLFLSVADYNHVHLTSSC